MEELYPKSFDVRMRSSCLRVQCSVTNLPSGQMKSDQISETFDFNEVDYDGYLLSPLQDSSRCAVVKPVLAGILGT
ncbi:hypothetical protein TNCV_4663471 [Trichonephila clavipes]|uniref:Uncharacterized protein n=1 Tax=Trichonephila clavipes TaxID=2585209 RepID=A0A8X6SIQ5_TRICX|nr:hypothetical protein TNCV_4663471 [Trichonephila clavipes]